jgi:hypothetical protein
VEVRALYIAQAAHRQDQLRDVRYDGDRFVLLREQHDRVEDLERLRAAGLDQAQQVRVVLLLVRERRDDGPGQMLDRLDGRVLRVHG